MEGDGMAADDDVLNIPRVEQSDKLAQICLQLRQESSCAARTGRRGALMGGWISTATS